MTVRNHGSLCVPQGTDGLTTMQGLPDAVDIKAQVSIRFFPRNSEDTSAEWSAGSRPDWLDLNVQTHWKKHQQGFKRTGDVTLPPCHMLTRRDWGFILLTKLWCYSFHQCEDKNNRSKTTKTLNSDAACRASVWSVISTDSNHTHVNHVDQFISEAISNDLITDRK